MTTPPSVTRESVGSSLPSCLLVAQRSGSRLRGSRSRLSCSSYTFSASFHSVGRGDWVGAPSRSAMQRRQYTASGTALSRFLSIRPPHDTQRP
jgi:uncharacterized membrane protein YbhN (UPF0104 family)